MSHILKKKAFRDMVQRIANGNPRPQCGHCGHPILVEDYVGLCRIGDSDDFSLVHAGDRTTLNAKIPCTPKELGVGYWDGREIVTFQELNA